MTCCHRVLAVASIWVTTFALGACGKVPAPALPATTVPTAAPLTIVPSPPMKASASLSLAVSPDVNPNAAGRPSPIVVRVYQLKSEGAFRSAEFAAIYDDEQKALGQELISRDQYDLTPGDRHVVEVALSEDARFVGAIAAFQNINQAQWRALLPTPRTGLKISVESARIVLTSE